MRVLRLAAAEGALYIACASFVCELELYEVQRAPRRCLLRVVTRRTCVARRSTALG